MLQSKALDIKDYEEPEMYRPLRLIHEGVARTRGRGLVAYIPHEHRYWEYASALAEAEELKPETILDVGCGFSGLSMAYHIQNPEARILEIDPKPKVYDNRKDIGTVLSPQIEFSLRDLLNFEGEFDFVSCISVMEHIPLNKQDEAWDAFLKLPKKGFVVTVDYNPKDPTWGRKGERNTYYNEQAIREIGDRCRDGGFRLNIDTTYRGPNVYDYTFFRLVGRR